MVGFVEPIWEGLILRGKLAIKVLGEDVRGAYILILNPNCLTANKIWSKSYTIKTGDCTVPIGEFILVLSSATC